MSTTSQTEWSRQASRRRRIREKFIHAARSPAGLACALCGQPINPDAPHLDPGELTVDHVTPLSAGGAPFEMKNCQAAHRACNRAAGDKREIQGRAHNQASLFQHSHPDGSLVTPEHPLIDDLGGRTWYANGQRCYITGRTW